jgi:hypothetical protein
MPGWGLSLVRWSFAPHPGTLALAAMAGLALGVATSVSLPLTAGLLLVAFVIFAFGRSRTRSEALVGLYWIAFCLYETAFSWLDVPGFFYPFYAAFALVIVVFLAKSQVRIDATLATIYVAFLVVVLVSFIGFASPIDFGVVQRVFAYSFGLVLMTQYASAKGLRTVIGAAIVAGVAVSIWVIDASVRGGFGYRGGVDVNQNDASFYIGLGLVPAFAGLLGLLVAAKMRPGRSLLLLIAVMVMSYAMVLLASRGMTIGILLSFAVVGALAIARNRRVLLPLLLVVMALGSMLLLPGGSAILGRFTGEAVESGNSRYPLWETTLDSFTGGTVSSILLGNGFDSNKVLLRQEFGWTASTHNAFLQVLFEFGFLGIALFLALHAALLLRGREIRGELGLVLVGQVVFLLGANLTTDTPNGFMYWTSIGLAMAIAVWGPTNESIHHRIGADAGGGP